MMEDCIDVPNFRKQLMEKVNVSSGEDAVITPTEYAEYAWAWHQHEADKHLRENICA